METTTNGNETFVTPSEEDFQNTALAGSMVDILSQNIGLYCLVEFLVGTTGIISLLGFLYDVGRGYLVLFDAFSNNYTVCDIFAVRFVTFLAPSNISGLSAMMNESQSRANQQSAAQNATQNAAQSAAPDPSAATLQSRGTAAPLRFYASRSVRTSGR